MTITRNNYESYFLLYADGELSDTEKQAVEQFVALHPDLGEELEMLKDTVLEIPANISMPGKNRLLKPEPWEEDNLTPHQQELFLLLDNELPESRISSLEAAINSDASLKKDWHELQQTRLVAPLISMPGKEALYRKEFDRKPIPIKIIRWMAAAAVITGLGWYAMAFWNNRAVTSTPEVASTITGDNSNRNSNKIRETAPAAPGQRGTEELTETNDQQANQENHPANAGKMLATQPLIRKEAPLQVNDQPVPTYTLAVENQPVIETVKEKNIVSNTKASLNLENVGSPLAIHAVETGGYDTYENTVAQQTVYNEDSFADDEYVTIAGARIKKQKLRGVFRNVTRTVARTFDKSNVAQADVASLK